MDIVFCQPDDPDNRPGTTLQQSGTYAAVLRSFGCATAVADIHHGGRRMARARIHLRRIGPLRLAWLPCGPVWDRAAPLALRHVALSALPRAAPFRAIWAVGGPAERNTPGIAVARGSRTATLDLRADDAARRAALGGKWRNHLNKAERAGMTIDARPLSLPRDDALLARETSQRKARRYSALPHAFNARWSALAPDDTLLLTASGAGEVLAFVLLLLHAPSATYHVGWTSGEGRARGAHALMLWRASCMLAERGYLDLDLGICDAARAPGIARFKLGTGARPQVAGPTRLRI